jgi:hypothetical protein
VKICFWVCDKPQRTSAALDKTKTGWIQLQVWLKRNPGWWVELGDKSTNKTISLTWNFTASSTNIHFVEKLWRLNMLRKLWCRLWASFDLTDLIIASFNPFCRKLMLNMGRSCTVQKSDVWAVGHCWKDFQLWGKKY